MFRKPYRVEALTPHVKRPIKSLLLIAGDGDDALFYHASASAGINGTLTVYLHRESLFLERVKLFGPLSVEVLFLDGQSFSGELALKKNAEGELSLMLKDELAKDIKEEQRLCPMT